MQRLVEQPVDDGEVLDGSSQVGRVHYHLSVYQQFSEGADQEVLPHFEVEGRLTPVDHFDIAQLHARAVELTLRLADGRLLDFLIAHDDGRIRSTGRGLYTP
jgi:hypothetical protein